ncbi:flagellar basal body rod protein FlgC [Timonella senegalensis]|uniref:flagellar basal body rod protein FlgC n=1 Tax=Timonella senegalensis TaxID=1465825 RepID=UPI0028ABE685|nr:flagellar basal body rod protein FlgC [Timonella senegalensis]
MTFDAIGIASTGMTVHRKWLDAISDNIANVNTVTSADEDAFAAKYVMAQAMGTGTENKGVQVSGIIEGNAEGRIVYEPDHPLANADGYVKYPDIDMSSQMTQLIMAQRGYQANAAVIERARSSYEQAIAIGQN